MPSNSKPTVDKSTLADWANMLQEGIDCVIHADIFRQGTDSKKFYWDRGMDHLKKVRGEILQAKHCSKD